MFPIPRLPDAATPLAKLIPRNRYITPAAGKKALCEPTLDSTPAFGKVIIARRQLPDAVKMIGEENERKYVKREVGADLADDGAQEPARARLGQDSAAAAGNHREEGGGGERAQGCQTGGWRGPRG